MKASRLRNEITGVALDILWMWNSAQLDSEAVGNVWHKVGERQSYHDALNVMRHRNLIEDFDMVKVAVKVDGQWITRAEV